MAANQGNANAQGHVGWFHQNGHGIDQDYVKAHEWFLKAANLGDAVAQHNVGWNYKKGLGIEEDKQQALHWFQLAADGGVADASKEIDRLKIQ